MAQGLGKQLEIALILPASSVRIKAQELKGPSPLLVKASILKQYQVNASTLRNSKKKTLASRTVAKRDKCPVSSSFGFC